MSAHTCKSVSLVSAYGVGDSLKSSEIGINLMNSIYLKSSYKSKNEQEIYLSTVECLKKFIYRPRELSYGKTIHKLRGHGVRNFKKHFGIQTGHVMTSFGSKP